MPGVRVGQLRVNWVRALIVRMLEVAEFENNSGRGATSEGEGLGRILLCVFQVLPGQIPPY
jgi:hypothetical protein